MQFSVNNQSLRIFLIKLQKRLDKICLNYLKKKLIIKSKKKNKYDAVTNLDIKIEKLLRKEIKKNYPKHNINGEELKNVERDSKFTWFIDPVDGTKALILGLPTWSNMICFFQEKNSICSLINFPVLKKFYIAISEKTFLFENNKFSIIKSSKTNNLKKAKIVTNSIHTLKNKRLMNFFQNFPGLFKITGSDSYNFCLIAEGKIDILIEDKLKIVDIMPIISIIENSGGVITDWKGNKNFYSGRIVAVSNKKLHQKVIKKLKNL
tara:strand:+ start:32616 stop:33407 length:792 start_codon:yes stop_codon:yes gene_type:complete